MNSDTVVAARSRHPLSRWLPRTRRQWASFNALEDLVRRTHDHLVVRTLEAKTDKSPLAQWRVGFQKVIHRRACELQRREAEHIYHTHPQAILNWVRNAADEERARREDKHIRADWARWIPEGLRLLQAAGIVAHFDFD
ncbi:uncharacterized protein LOC62_01G001500 [Vanrija pseudolonga]|uniref:Uncharacterized protein n=1 Tax=Vanrija pseudolonga TaxID=143232 RepID=A0AAF0Y144_9TREE|nr:hypothetical protein LOC62_01G001500 [Vanrija pseudolonga]